MDRPARFFVSLSSVLPTGNEAGSSSEGRCSERLSLAKAPTQNANGTVVELSERDAHHARDVLRLSVNQAVHIITLPDQQAYSATIVSLHPSVHARLDSPIGSSEADGRGDTLLLPILKGDRSEWAIEKAVELGVASIVLYEADRSVSRLKERSMASKLERWERIAEAAAKQSSRRSLATISIQGNLSSALSDHSHGLYGDLSPTARSLRSLDPLPKTCVAAGPEGGFSQEELFALHAAHFTPVSLGPLVLRAETAAITLLASVNALWGVPKS